MMTYTTFEKSDINLDGLSIWEDNRKLTDLRICIIFNELGKYYSR